ncbi:MAG: DnaA ATPase domain-containing protein, partial [Planctomycetota bacterium]
MALTSVEHWQVILDSLKEQIPAASFNTWFKHTTLDSFSEERVIIGVASLFIKERIADHYQRQISQIIADRFAIRPEIQFRVSAKPLQELRKEQKASVALPLRPSPSAYSAAGSASSYTNRLNPEFTLQNFFAGPSNQIALGACLRVVAAPAEFNPLTIRGGSGLGKTHLLQAICHEIQRKDPDQRVVFLSCEAFANQFMKAIIDKDRPAFQQRLRNCDVLILDDIQFLVRGNKEATQEELLHTFDALEHAGRQVILSCDQDPRTLEGLMPRLAKRFVSGLTVALESPCQETCRSIVLKKAALRGLCLSDDLAELIASNTEACGREIEGAVARLAAISKIMECAPSLEMVEEFLALGRKA